MPPPNYYIIPMHGKIFKLISPSKYSLYVLFMAPARVERQLLLAIFYQP